jgi:glycosyltransferase involved in cell wall biosynthesis
MKQLEIAPGLTQSGDRPSMSQLKISPRDAPCLARRILVFNDATGFGGHELAFLKFLPHLLQSNHISEMNFIYYEGNRRFGDLLKEIDCSKIRLFPGPFRQSRASNLTAPLRSSYAAYVRDRYNSVSPDIVLLLQGRIEVAAVPMIALPRAADVVSYIPMAHNAADLGKGTIGYDFLRRRYYRRPQRFMVPSAAAANQLRRAGATGRIEVVPNFVPRHPAPDEQETRASLGIPKSKKVALFMGRFATQQKGLDKLLAAIEQDAENLSDWYFLFVGEGDGEPAIRATLDRLGVRNGAILGWTDHARDILASSDVLLMPSRYEGVPLLMLEALFDGVPILSSDIDVYREYLPAFCRWDFRLSDIRRPDPRKPGISQHLEHLVQTRKDFQAHASNLHLQEDPGVSAQLFEDGLLG